MCAAAEKCHSRLLKAGIGCFAAAEWVCVMGYAMFPLGQGEAVPFFQDAMRAAVTISASAFLAVSLVLTAVGGRKEKLRSLSRLAVDILICAVIALVLAPIWIGPIANFYERVCIFSTVAFNAGLCFNLMRGAFSGQETRKGRKNMSEYQYITLRQRPDLAARAAKWFHEKWGVPEEAYLECIDAYLDRETEYGWYLCLDGEKIIGGLGVIENDFHDRKDLAPNVCAVYTEEAYRKQGVAGKLLNLAVEDMREKGVSPVYLLTDHVGFYERYGWEFFCMAQGDGEERPSRLYIHR